MRASGRRHSPADPSKNNNTALGLSLSLFPAQNPVSSTLLQRK